MTYLTLNCNRTTDYYNTDIQNWQTIKRQISEGLFMKHYGHINNSGYNWSSVPCMIIAKKAKTSIGNEMYKNLQI